MDFWSCLIDCFTKAGDWNKLKIYCIEHGVQGIITRDLIDLRAALNGSASACELVASNASETGRALDTARELQQLFRAMRAMISVGDSTEFPAWRHIHQILNLPASMEDLATSRLSSGVSGSSGRFIGVSNSTNKLSSSTLTPGRSYKSTSPNAASPPGPLIARGLSITHDMSNNAKSSPSTAQRQTSLVRESTGASVRMVPMATSSSPMTSPRRAAHVLSDPLAPRTSSRTGSSANFSREPYSGRRSSHNIGLSPPGPARMARSVEDLSSVRGKSAIVPPTSGFNQTCGDLSTLRLDSSANISQFAATAPPQFPSNSILRATSGVFRGASGGMASTVRLPNDSNPNGPMRGNSMVTTAGAELNSNLVRVVTTGLSPEFSPGPVVRGSSVVASASRLQRSHSPIARGSSVTAEAHSRGTSLVTSAARAPSVESARPGRSPHSYVSEAGMSGPTPNPEVRVLMPGHSLLSARQWVPAAPSGRSQESVDPIPYDPGTTFIVPGPSTQRTAQPMLYQSR
jgi:hypothetical protein